MGESRDQSCVWSAWNCDGRDVNEATNIDTALMDGYIALIAMHAESILHVCRLGFCCARAGCTMRYCTSIKHSLQLWTIQYIWKMSHKTWQVTAIKNDGPLCRRPLPPVSSLMLWEVEQQPVNSRYGKAKFNPEIIGVE